MSKPSPARYRTTNWSSDTASLRKRGSLLIWLDQDMTWLAPHVGRCGHRHLSLKGFIVPLHLRRIKARECRPMSANARECGRMPFFRRGVDVALM
jgi:hypothetical protein